MQLGLSLGLTRLGGTSLTAQALAILRTYGTDAHLWLPGVGVVNGIAAGNFIESIGTSAAVVDSPVGYVGDAGKTLGAELVGNSTFDAPGWWSLSGATISGGMLNLVTAGEYVGATRLNTLVVGKVYQVEADVVKNSGTGSVFVGNPSVGVTRATTGKLSGVFVASDTTLEIKRFSGSLDATLDNVSVREIVGAIPATQSTTAAKPLLRQSGGLYSWQFDGTDFLTLGSVPFQQADGQVVIAAAAASSYSAQRMVCAPSCSASTFAKNASVLFGTDGAPRARWTNNTPTDFTVTSPSAIPAGQAAVLTARKVGTTGSLRVNGAAQGTPITISGTITADSGGIGTERTSNPSGLFIGNIGPVIAIKGTVSDADLLILEKWIGSLSGVTI